MKRFFLLFALVASFALLTPARAQITPASQWTDAELVDVQVGLLRKPGGGSTEVEIMFRGDNPGILTELCAAAQNPSPQARLLTAGIMAELGSPKAVPCLTDRLAKETHYQVLMWDVTDAGLIGDPAFIPSLKALYQKVAAGALPPNSDPRQGMTIPADTFKSKIILALAQCKCPKLGPAYRKDALAMTGENKSLALLGLAKMGDPGIYKVIVPIMKQKRPGNSGDWDMDVLAETGGIQDLPLLSAYRPGGPLDQITLELQIKGLPPGQQVPKLVAALSSTHASVQKWAAGKLGELGTPEAVKALADALQDPRLPYFYAEAFTGLRKNGKTITRTLSPDGRQSTYKVQ